MKVKVSGKNVSKKSNNKYINKQAEAMSSLMPNMLPSMPQSFLKVTSWLTQLLLEMVYVFSFQKIVMVSAIWKKVGWFHH